MRRGTPRPRREERNALRERENSLFPFTFSLRGLGVLRRIGGGILLVCAPAGFRLERPAFNIPRVALRPEALAMRKLLLLQLMLKSEKYFMVTEMWPDNRME
jgi:hypothetical protein